MITLSTVEQQKQQETTSCQLVTRALQFNKCFLYVPLNDFHWYHLLYIMVHIFITHPLILLLVVFSKTLLVYLYIDVWNEWVSSMYFLTKLQQKVECVCVCMWTHLLLNKNIHFVWRAQTMCILWTERSNSLDGAKSRKSTLELGKR
jgi:hypothetical protein